MDTDEKQDNQRERLLRAIVEEVGERGLEQTTVAHVVAQAGVSRPTFYVHFIDRQACVIAALRDIQATLVTQIAQEISRNEPQRAAHATVVALVAFADAQPAAARLLMHESLAGGSEVLDARDEGLAASVTLIEQAYGELPGDSRVPDLPAEMLLGAVHRLLASRLRRGERGLRSLRDDLLDWITCFERPITEQRWVKVSHDPLLGRSAFLPDAPLRAPTPLRPGRPRRSSGTITENQRLRIIFAAAEMIAERGYLKTSVTEMIRAAGVDHRAFYELFSDKQDALMAVHELGFQRTMAVTAGAFFAADEWPARIWEGARAFTQCLDQNPNFSRVALLEGHSGSPETVQRLEDLTAGFTIFLQEGFQYQPSAVGGPSALALEAIAAANIEALYRQARRGSEKMASQAPTIAYSCLAPFISPGRADQAIDKLIAGERDGRPTPPARR